MEKTVLVCVWTYSEGEDAWDSACGEKWIFIEGNLTENRVRFCHWCGKPVTEQREKQS